MGHFIRYCQVAENSTTWTHLKSTQADHEADGVDLREKRRSCFRLVAEVKDTEPKATSTGRYLVHSFKFMSVVRGSQGGRNS